MPEITLSPSLKAIYLNRNQVLADLKGLSPQAFAEFSALQEIRVFGSVARDESWGLSDLDLLLIVKGLVDADVLDRIRPFYRFFAHNLNLAVDLLIVDEEQKDKYRDFLAGSISVAVRGSSL